MDMNNEYVPKLCCENIKKLLRHDDVVISIENTATYEGKIIEIGAIFIKAYLPLAKIGSIYQIKPSDEFAEVISINEMSVTLLPFCDMSGMFLGQWLSFYQSEFFISVGYGLLGRVVNGLGHPLAAGDKLTNIPYQRSLFIEPPDPLSRAIIDKPLSVGVKAIDGLLTCGVGQRIGIFAGSGVGKSTLLGMICNGAQADIIVMALIGERGREVNEFLALLPEETRLRSVFVVTTSDRPPLERMKAAFTATTIAEFFRDQGKHVLLIMDSVTRYARAARDVGLSIGEPDIRGGFPPSVFATLPRLLERAGPAAVGAITAIYSVLIENDDANDPIADEVRSILDGHIILSRKLAEENHYPAIDVGLSASRIMINVTSREQSNAAATLKSMIATYKDVELLLRIGEYKHGEDPQVDRAIHLWPQIQSFCRQPFDSVMEFNTTINELFRTVG
nr:FliI/YscN family ATPase [Edwardsiella anguillarum]